MQLALIVAAAANNVIGNDNKMPWHLPQDFKYFKTHTLGKPIIMGRKTYDSIGKPLPGRTSIVITRQPDWVGGDGVLVAHDLAQALALARQVLSDAQVPHSEAMIIGGAEIYRASLPIADRVYLTRINKNFVGDACFPELAATEWKEVSSTEGDINATEPHTFLVYERIAQ